MRDVKDAAHPRGTTITIRDLFFNVPARRKFLRSEATETFHLTNLITHYALAHPEIAFTFTNNGREVIRATAAKDLRERAYQIFGEEFLDNLLEVNGGHGQVARVLGYVSAPRDRRTSRDSQYLFVNRRFVRDRMIGRALSEGYRSILPHGVYPAALLFIETPLEEVDVNVHPAKTEVRFRRSAAVADAVRESVRMALAAAGFVREEATASAVAGAGTGNERVALNQGDGTTTLMAVAPSTDATKISTPFPVSGPLPAAEPTASPQSRIDFFSLMSSVEEALEEEVTLTPSIPDPIATVGAEESETDADLRNEIPSAAIKGSVLPPLNSAEKIARPVTPESLSPNIRPLGQLEESFIIATDDEGLLLIDQHVAHERVLFDKYRALEAERRTDSQQLLVPETFDLTPAQAAVFDQLAPELEKYGFDLMRLSGRTVAIKATPADLPASEARNMLYELLETVDAEKKGSARETLRDEIAASLACHAAIKVNMPLAPEKMRWLIDRLLQTSSPTTCPHGRPVILRLKTRDILKGFHRI
jgi:DNA mismatch repair protein MutL